MLVGIDLGTTNSAIGIYRDGQTRLIPNALGHVLTPSAVSLAEDGSMLVGLAARERLSTHPGMTAVAFKRWMGSDHKLMLGRRAMRAEELSSLVLAALKQDAEAWLGQPVTEAVITVPAYFNEAQRRATQTAGRLAGLKVERLLNEPTAAGLAYGLQERPDNSTFLIFDLGGGTFDVSVIEYFEGVVEVRASAGDTRLGGEDFTQVMVDWIAEKAKLRIKSASAEDRRRLLWRAAEQAKRDLSESEQAAVTFTHAEQEIAMELQRSEYERRCETLIQSLRRPIERALRDARLDPGQLDEVVLVGGASRIPLVRQMVARLFGRLPLRSIDPDETIARGAAIQAALKARDAALNEVVLTDVMPYSLGLLVTENVGGQLLSNRYSPIIERNTPVPVSRTGQFFTTVDQQKVVALDIRQGESPIGVENLQLGLLEMPVPPMPKGQVSVEVRFSYDPNGLLEVDAHVLQSGFKTQQLIQREGGAMTEAQVAETIERLRALKIHPRDQQENAYLIARARRLYEDRLGADRLAIGQALSQFEALLQSQDEHQIRHGRASLQRLLDALDGGFVL